MKMHTRIITCLLIFSMVLSFIPPVFGAEDDASTLVFDEYREIATDNEWAALRLINARRVENGLTPLAMLEDMQAVAAVRSLELETAFSHDRVDGSPWYTAVDASGISYSIATELIARPYSMAQDVVARWLNAESEAEALMGDYTHIAISHNVNADTWCGILINSESITGLQLHKSGKRYMTAGETLESLGLIATVKSANGDGYIPLSDSMITGINPNKAGNQIGTFSIGAYSIEFTIEVRFTDVNYNLWYNPYIRYVTQNGLFNGVSDTEFSPDSSMTRAMFVTVLGRQSELMGLEISGNSSVFSDVEENVWYTPYIGWAAENGITTGYGDEFGINDEVTREQVATFLLRFAQYIGIELPEAGQVEYLDRDSVSDWALAAVDTCIALGLIDIQGYGFMPQQPATRAVVAKAITVLATNYINTK